MVTLWCSRMLWCCCSFGDSVVLSYAVVVRLWCYRMLWWVLQLWWCGCGAIVCCGGAAVVVQLWGFCVVLSYTIVCCGAAAVVVIM